MVTTHDTPEAALAEALTTAFHQHRVDVARATGRSWLHVQ